MKYGARSDLIILERADTGITPRAPCKVNTDCLECVPLIDNHEPTHLMNGVNGQLH
jgi:hypothetical protein